MKKLVIVFLIAFSCTAMANSYERFADASKYQRIQDKFRTGKVNELSHKERLEFVNDALEDVHHMQHELQTENQVTLDKKSPVALRIGAGGLGIVTLLKTGEKLKAIYDRSQTSSLPFSELPSDVTRTGRIFMTPVSWLENLAFGSKHSDRPFSFVDRHVSEPLATKGRYVSESAWKSTAINSASALAYTVITVSLLKYAFTSTEKVPVNAAEKRAIETQLGNLEHNLLTYKASLEGRGISKM